MTTEQLIIIILGMSIPFLATTLGALVVYFFKGEIGNKLNSILLGFAAGIMIAASIWSLILPSLEYARNNGWDNLAIIPVAVGFLLGALFLWGIDKLVPHLHERSQNVEGLPAKKLSRDIKIFLAMTIHNFPEGIAVGFAFAVAYAGILDPANAQLSVYGALALSIGIALQNIPEGAAVSLPMAQNLKSKNRAFFYGVFSAIVEPIGGILAFLFAWLFKDLFPWFLSFAAGAMIYVVVEELIPEAELSETEHLGTFAVIFGFLLMMILDVVLS